MGIAHDLTLDGVVALPLTLDGVVVFPLSLAEWRVSLGSGIPAELSGMESVVG